MPRCMCNDVHVINISVIVAMKSTPYDAADQHMSQALSTMFTALVGAPPTAMKHKDWR